MTIRHSSRQIVLLIVDCLILCISLVLAFSFRTGAIIPFGEVIHILNPFILVILSSVTVFYIYGLYDKPTLKLTRELSSRITTSQILSGALAIILFYNLPFLGVAPKTILILYLIFSSVLSILWRKYAYNILLRKKQQTAVIIGSGKSFMLLCDEFSRNPHLGISLVSIIDLDTYPLENIQAVLSRLKPDTIIADLRDNRLQLYLGTLYNQLFHNVTILDIVDVYKDVFEAVPLDIINQEWLLRHIDLSRRYTTLKRGVDILITIPLFIVSLFLYPFIYLAIKLEDQGSLFFTSVRIGKNGEPFTFYKIRSMTETKHIDFKNDSHSRVTRVGKFIRATRLDEIPQFLNVLKGDLALVGPRPEVPAIVEEYNKSIRYYPMRHLVRPGVFGWAQIQQHEAPKFGIDINQTSTKLSYDLYYMSNGSLLFDFAICLKTIKVLLGKTGL